MQNDSKSRYNAHLIRLLVAAVVVAVLGFAGKKIVTPESMGQFGHYRGSDIEDQKMVPVKFGTNESCFTCHRPVRTIHKAGVHRTVSCEICHGPFGDHIADGNKIGTLPVKRGDEITDLCLRCHNEVIQARPRTSIKMVGMPRHLQEHNVKLSHNCSQCHMVHDPLLWINQAKEMMGVATIEPLNKSGTN